MSGHVGASLRPLTYRMILTWNVIQQCDNRRVGCDANNATGVCVRGTTAWQAKIARFAPQKHPQTRLFNATKVHEKRMFNKQK